MKIPLSVEEFQQKPYYSLIAQKQYTFRLCVINVFPKYVLEAKNSFSIN